MARRAGIGRRTTGARAPASVSATDAARGFGRLVDHVREQHVEYVVERGGVAVARIGPASERRCTLRDFVALLRSRSPANESYLREVEAASKSANRPAVPRSPWERSSTRAS